MRLEKDENFSPLIRPISAVGLKVYAALRLFIANKVDRFKLQATLLELGVSEQAVFAAEFQQLLSRHVENAAVLFAQLRTPLMKEIGGLANNVVIPPVMIPVVTEEPSKVDTGTMTARTSDNRKSARTQTPRVSASPLMTPRAPHYDPLPLKKGWNPMFDAQVRKITKAQELAAKKLIKVLKDRPVAASMLAVVPKSFVDRTLKEGELIKRRNAAAAAAVTYSL
jgi:hypothetical protein